MLATQVEYWKLQETGRHNVVTEAQGWKNLEIAEFSAREVQRHNLATEGIEGEKVQISWASLAETSRHNQAQEQENVRHNIQSEGIGWGNLGLGYDQLKETSRHNQATEALGWGQLNESVRHNMETESLGWKSLANDVHRTNIQQSQQEAQAEYWDRMATNAEQQTINQAMLGFGNLETAQRNAETARLNWENAMYRLEHDINYDWANFAEDTAVDISKEARGWFDSITSNKRENQKANKGK